MTLGAEPKKLAILGGLLVLAAAVYFWPSSDDAPSDAKASSSGRGASAPASPSSGGRGTAASSPNNNAATSAGLPMKPGSQNPNISRAGAQGRSQEFRPAWRRKQEERVAPESIDPTLRLDLLARVQGVALTGGQRSLFDFAAQPVAAPKVAPIKVQGDGKKSPNISAIPLGPNPAPPPPPPPPPPPITLKFYGFVNSPSTGRKRAFFIDGDDIFVASEGEVVKRHYKIVRIGVNSAVVEDTDNKHQQTLALEEQQG